MCGRFAQHVKQTDWDALAAALGADSSPAPPARFNIAPTQRATGFVHDGVVRAVALGFGMPRGISGWVINARLETLQERPLFRGLVKNHRAIVVASSFYEWRATPSGKQPFGIARSDRLPLCFAALRERKDGPGAVILTRAASDDMAALHSRMPVILSTHQAKQWLDPIMGADDAVAWLLPAACKLEHWPVTRAINSPGHDGPDCVQPLPGPEQGQLPF